jgi:hypothetical protein
MKISKSHKYFANRLHRLRQITNQEDLTHPERYLGSNWEAVINFWLYLDTLSEEQFEIVEGRYLALSGID